MQIHRSMNYLPYLACIPLISSRANLKLGSYPVCRCVENKICSKISS